MKHPETWSQLTSEPELKPVDPLHALRASTDAVFEFVEGDAEYMAVKGTEPYGSLSEDAFDQPQRFNLLRAVRKGVDYVEFEVPGEALTFSALTFGNGARGYKLLMLLYQQAGELIRKVAVSTDNTAPLFKVGDLAFDRAAGEAILLPPLDFGEQPHTVSDYEDVFTGSIQDAFSGFLNQNKISELAEAVQKGMGNDTARQRS